MSLDVPHPDNPTMVGYLSIAAAFTPNGVPWCSMLFWPVLLHGCYIETSRRVCGTMASMDPREPREPVRLIIVPPSAAGIAVLVERITGRKPDLAKIRARIAARARTDDRPLDD